MDLTARVPSIPREGETVLGSSFAMGPGGKAPTSGRGAPRGRGRHADHQVGRDAFGEAARAYKMEGMRMDCVLSGDGTGWR